MPAQYYIIPATQPPYTTGANRRPEYINTIQCNSTHMYVPDLDVFVCKVFTTTAKHAALAASSGVRQMPAGLTWDTIISTMTTPQRNAVSQWCTDHGVAYDATETIGELLQRIISCGLYTLGNIATNTQYGNLTQGQKDKIIEQCNKWGKKIPDNTETVKGFSKRLGGDFWNAKFIQMPEF